MRKRDYIARWGTALPLAVLLSLTGCAKEELVRGKEDPATGGKSVKVMLNLSVDIAGSSGTRTRAAGDEIITPGTDKESAVKSLTVFIVDVNSNGNEAKTAKHATFDFDWDGSGQISSDPVQIQTTTGRKHIYIGANLTGRQIVAFAGGGGNGINSAYTVRTGLDYVHPDLMMAEFIKDGGGFTMFGMAKHGQSEEIEIPDIPITKLDLSVELSRVVAKVLVVVDTEQREPDYGGVLGVEYAKVSSRDGQNDGLDAKSWIRLNDIQFTLNISNRKLFLNQQKNDDNQVIDPNYKFEDLIEYVDGVFRFNSDIHSRNFVRWMPQVWNTADPWGMQALKYEQDKMPTWEGNPNGSGVYTQGLYCLENMVGPIPDEWATVPELKDNEEALTFLATTYVLIAAKMTPRWIIRNSTEDPAIITNGEAGKPYRAQSEEDALRQLPASRDEQHGAHPEGTFYSPDREHFYSYDGMMARIKHDEELSDTDPNDPDHQHEKLTRENFLCYPGGWGYYFTYVDGLKNYDPPYNGNTLRFDSERSSVLRNYYYILHVKELGLPPFPGEGIVNSMEVEVRRYGWTDAGEGNLTLKP